MSAITWPRFTRSPIFTRTRMILPLMRAATSPRWMATMRPVMGTILIIGSEVTSPNSTSVGGRLRLPPPGGPRRAWPALLPPNLLLMNFCLSSGLMAKKRERSSSVRL